MESVFGKLAAAIEKISNRAALMVSVKRGDSLYAIALANGVTLDELKAANPHLGPNFNQIEVGDKVTIPGQSEIGGGGQL